MPQPKPQPPKTDRAARRRDREREARLARIRRAGARVFAELGYERATMERVAEAAELGKATLYYYFPTKQALFADIISAEAERLREVANAHRVKKGADPLAAAEAVYAFSLDYFREAGDLAALLLPLMAAGQERLEARLGPEVARAVGAAHAPLMRGLAPLAKDLEGGEAIFELMASLLIGLATKARAGGGERLEAEIELFFHLLRRASGARR